jgi:rhodanese-related sulfurtransferase/uncharacterized membrane protein YedE/YeeE
MAPPDLSSLGHAGNILLSLAIGFTFGFILERAGFGDARKLAAQFYFYDQAVLKVMFTAIIVAMLLLFTTVQLGWLDFERVWVNPTYIWPGIIGGVLLGIGFILGGYCPGTSVVATATLKVDGLFFLLGCFLGIFAFGPTVPLFHAFWERAGYLGRLTIPEWLGLSNGVVVLLAVLMALTMFAGAEWLESHCGKKQPSQPISGDSHPPLRERLSGKHFAAAALLLLASGLAICTHLVPDPAEVRLRRQAEQEIASRQRHIEPPELLDLMHNNQITLLLFDVRDEADYNLFHLVDAKRISRDPFQKTKWAKGLPADAIKVVMSNGEEAANTAAVELIARGVRNVYILAGGINHWLDVYGQGIGKPLHSTHADALRYEFPAALGANYPAADPDRWSTPQLPFTPKVHFEKPIIKISGGCGG